MRCHDGRFASWEGESLGDIVSNHGTVARLPILILSWPANPWAPEFCRATTAGTGGGNPTDGGRWGGAEMRGNAPLYKLRKVGSEGLALAFELAKHALKDVVKHGLVPLGLAKLISEPMDLRLKIFHLVLTPLAMLALSLTQLRSSAL
jgi:hypothetical protein